MRVILRSLQTLFPYLQDVRFSFRTLIIKLARVPIENDFYALKLFKPAADQVFVDIGANRGHAILSMLLFSQFKNKIVAFEPNPLVFEKIKNNHFIQNNSRVTLYNYGLGDSNEELTLFVPFYRRWMFDGLSSFSYKLAKGWLRKRLWGFNEKKLSIREVKCQLRRLDDFHLNPYFIKIDVQGFEMNVLRGAAETIIAHRPVLLIEGISAEIVRYLEQYDYLFFTYEKGKLTEGKGMDNTFCISRERYGQITISGRSLAQEKPDFRTA